MRRGKTRLIYLISIIYRDAYKLELELCVFQQKVL